jgi:hypothetical protein
VARIRTVKPSLFRHEELYTAELATKLPLRLSFIGLLTVVDREGRFRWKPNEIKLDVLPHDKVDFDKVLAALADYGFVVRYAVDEKQYGYIPTFLSHQNINVREASSALPDPLSDICVHIPTQCAHDTDPVHASGEGKGREGNRKGREGKAELSQSVLALPPLAEIWNSNRGEKLPLVRACGKSRLTSARERWAESPSEEFWRGVMEKLRASAFCTGSNERSWVADFDWFIRPDTANRILEGKYDRASTSRKKSAFERNDNLDENLFEAKT